MGFRPRLAFVSRSSQAASKGVDSARFFALISVAGNFVSMLQNCHSAAAPNVITVQVMAALILIVEDEADLVHNLEYNLQLEGYDTRAALDAESALDALDEMPAPDLVVLDLMLPDMSGIELCRRIRNDETTRHVPVLMLTARGEEIDRITGFEAGADDYVVKPFSIRELKLRMRAILRRSEADTDESFDEEIEFGRLCIDIPGHGVERDGEPLELTPLEFRLFKTLFLRRGRTQSRQVLLRDVWDIKADVMTRTVDTHVKRLRTKLGECGDYIETVRGVGYCFVADVS